VPCPLLRYVEYTVPATTMMMTANLLISVVVLPNIIIKLHRVQAVVRLSNTTQRGFDDALRSVGRSYPCFVRPTQRHCETS